MAFLDDDPIFVRTIAKLQEAHGLPPLASTSWQEVLEWVRDGVISTVVSDLRMPDLDGISFLEKVRRIDPEISLILLTAFEPDSQDMRRMARLGASLQSKARDLPKLLNELTPLTPGHPGGHLYSVPEGMPATPSTTAGLQTVFLSYGGPDEGIAREIYDGLTSKGASVFFFPESALPGQRLHRTMAEGVEDCDRVVLLCSRSSLKRPGVLNELEQVFAREAREGGAEVLVPIALDDFVFSE